MPLNKEIRSQNHYKKNKSKEFSKDTTMKTLKKKRMKKMDLLNNNKVKGRKMHL